MHSILNMSDMDSQGTNNLCTNSPKSQERNSSTIDNLLSPEGNNISVDKLDKDVATPNNDFDKHSLSDFMETQLDEDSEKHRRMYKTTWAQIHKLVGK